MTVPDCYYISQDTAFGHTLVRRQWPLITSQAIDNVNASIALLDATRDAAKVNEGKQLIQQLEKLKYEVENNKSYLPFLSLKIINTPICANTTTWYQSS